MTEDNKSSIISNDECECDISTVESKNEDVNNMTPLIKACLNNNINEVVSLIKNGEATLCMSINDFFDDEKKQKNEKNIHQENNILDKIGMIPVSESVLANLVKKSVAEIKSELVVLELQGLIRKQDGGYVLN